MPTLRALLALALLLALATTPLAAQEADEEADDGNPCTDTADTAEPYAVEVDGEVDGEFDGEEATGILALPAEDPTALVVFAHGYGHASPSWVDHARRTAAELGAAAVAMDYRGTTTTEDGTIRGWRVREGAQDSIAAARNLEARCGGFDTIVLFGVSMGGNASGLALAERPTRLDGTTPLFDWWFDIEGAVNVIETYQGARVLAPANAFAANAVADIEQEMGGTFEEVPEVYADHAVVARVDDIAASGVKGVFVTHAIEDGLVPYDQSVEVVGLLTEAGVPTEFVTHTTRGEGEGGTTITGYVAPGSPLAGHASETSTTHVVMREGLDRLAALLVDGVDICTRRAVKDGDGSSVAVGSCA